MVQTWKHPVYKLHRLRDNVIMTDIVQIMSDTKPKLVIIEHNTVDENANETVKVWTECKTLQHIKHTVIQNMRICC